MIILVTGTPGTGKTFFSRLLASELGCKPLKSRELLEARGGIRKDPTGRLTNPIDPNALALAATEIALLSSQGQCIIIETLCPSLWLENSKFYEETAIIILLRTNPLVLFERLKKRGWPEEKIIENVEAEFINAIASELIEHSHSTIEIDNSNVNKYNILNLFFNKLYTWDVGIKIDWTEEQDLIRKIIFLSNKINFDKYRLGI